MADAFVAAAGVATAHFGTNDTALLLGNLALPNAYLAGRWAATGATMNLVVDVRNDGGVVTRIRIPRARPNAGSAGHVRVFDGAKAAARNGDAERATHHRDCHVGPCDSFVVAGAVPDTIARTLERYRFRSDGAGVQWTFEGHPSQRTRIVLTIADDSYVLELEEYAGGEGYEDEQVFSREQEGGLVTRIESWCDAALEPYVKTRLQRWFEPWIGHDAAWAIFRGTCIRRKRR